MMGELRCPMCGKANPEDQDICQHCQARLKPLIAGDDAGELANQQSIGQPDEPVLSEAESLPDWLKSLRKNEPDTIEPEPENLPEWLKYSQTEPVEEDASVEAELPDWLNDLRQENLSDESDYGGELEGATWSTDQEMSGGEDLPDWLVAMGQESETTEPDEATLDEYSMHNEGEEPDWLEQLGGQPASPEEIQPFTFDYEAEQFVQSLEYDAHEVSDIDETDEVSPGVPLPEDETTGLPEWVAGLGVTAFDEPREETPDWLREIEDSPISSQDDIIERPIWLPGEVETTSREEAIEISANQAILDEHAREDESVEPSVDVEAEEEAVLDWLDDLVSDEAVTVAAIEERGEDQEDDVPDWLASYDETEAIIDKPLAESDVEGHNLDMDWLETQSEEITKLEAVSFPEEESVSISPFYEEDEDIQPLIIDEVPEWLGEPPQISDVTELEIGSGDEQEDALEPADLPAWLSAMRPIEAAAPMLPIQDEGERHIEGSGPLVGLRSVLPSEYDESGMKVAPTYSVKLQVSESQKAHADLVEEMIRTEGEASEISSHRVLGAQQLLFIGIFVLLLIVLMWPVVRGSHETDLPFYTQEVFETSSLINDLPGNAPVLLAIEYEPGLSGEMEATANAVVDHLMLKGAYLTLVTTKPSGPPLAERLIQGVSERNGHTYEDINQYTNLGFIPGGQSGMRNFAETPQRLAPYAIDGNIVWQSGPLASIRSLADFAMVMVFTEDPNTARAWVEQVQPTLEETPMVMVVSAQVEPILRPYYEATPKQVQGLIAGLPGGATYESLNGRSGLARNYWDAYSFGISLIALAIVVGGTINIVMAFISNRQQVL